MKPKKKKLRSAATPSAKIRLLQLGQNVLQARTDAEMTQLQLAHAIGYDGKDAGAFISRVESGKQEPRIETLSRIATALRVHVCSLLPQ